MGALEEARLAAVCGCDYNEEDEGDLVELVGGGGGGKAPGDAMEAAVRALLLGLGEDDRRSFFFRFVSKSKSISAPSSPLFFFPATPHQTLASQLTSDLVAPFAPMAAPKPIWVRQAEEAKLKSEADTTAAAKDAFDATFRALSASAHADQPPQHDHPEPSSSSPANPSAFPALRAASADSDSDSDDDDRPRAPPGPVDPSKSSAAGPGIAGGSAGTPATFTVVGKDRDGRRVTSGGAHVLVRVRPADSSASSSSDLEGAVRDNADGSYAVTYVVPKRGNYTAHVDLDGAPIMGSPFPVFFSAASTTTTTSPYPTKGSNFPVVLPGVGASLGKICREHISGRCTKGTDCRFSHPPQLLLMSVMAATTSTSTLGHAPMAPSAAAMAAAQAIMAAQALQAHAAKMQADAKLAAQAPDEQEVLCRVHREVEEAPEEEKPDEDLHHDPHLALRICVCTLLDDCCLGDFVM